MIRRAPRRLASRPAAVALPIVAVMARAVLVMAAPTPAGVLDEMTVAPRVSQDSGVWHDIRVQLVAHNAASLGSPMSGRLAEFPLRDGDRFQQGQVLDVSSAASRRARWRMRRRC
jgi:hypothetical protein